VVAGTGPVSVDTANLVKQPGVPTPFGDQIVATSNVPYHEPNPGPTPTLGTFAPVENVLILPQQKELSAATQYQAKDRRQVKTAHPRAVQRQHRQQGIYC